MDKDLNQDYQKVKKLPIVAALLPGSFLAILNQTLLTTAIPHMMSDFQLTENEAQWIMTIFMLVNGIMVPATAFLIETFTTRRLLLSAMSLFATGTLLCALAPSYLLVMVGRVIQAAGAGIMMPLMMTVFLLIFPFERRGSAMGMVGLVIGFAPAIGPPLAGWLVDSYTWRSLFWIVFPLAILNLTFAYFVMKNVTERTFPKVDVKSFILSTLGFGGLLYGFSSAGDYGWLNVIVIGSIFGGALTLTLFIRRQFQLEQPILEFRLFSNKVFTLTLIIGMVTFMSLIASEVIIPIYMQTMAGYSALDSGFVLLPGALLMGLLSPITGRIFDRIGGRWLLITGLTILTISTLFFTRLTPETSMTYLTIFFAIRMLGIVLVLMPSSTEGLNQLSHRLIPHGTAMTNTMRQVAASIGTAILITIMSNTALDTRQYLDPTHAVLGVNVAFFVMTAVTFVSLIMAFYIKGKKSVQELPNLKQTEHP